MSFAGGGTDAEFIVNGTIFSVAAPVMCSAALLNQPAAYMTTDGAATANFVYPFQPPHFGIGPHHSVLYFTNRSIRSDHLPVFFVQNHTYAELSSSVPGHCNNVAFSESKSAVQEQDAAIALISLKSCTSATSPPHSTPIPIFTDAMSNTKMVTSVIHTQEPKTELMQALRQSDAGSSAPGDTINGYEPQTSTCTTDQQCDVKHSPLSIQPVITSDGVTPASISPTMNSMVEHSPLTKPKRTPSKSGNIVCKLCGKSYAQLKAHMRMHSGEKPYRCDTCGKAFTQASNLTVHLRTHSGEKPFSCPICHTCFSQSSSVKTHLRTHSGERPYRCDYCSKAFSDISTLTKHKRIHSGEKPYRCKICSLGFSQSGNLHLHMKIHTNTIQ